MIDFVGNTVKSYTINIEDHSIPYKIDIADADVIGANRIDEITLA